MNHDATPTRLTMCAIALVCLLGCGRSSVDGPTRLLAPNSPLPALSAEGWLNGPGPTNEELRGEVVVIDVWAYWCPPCRAAMPEMVATHARYQDRGVRFIGLTMEGSGTLPDTESIVNSAKLAWPNGYGAGATIQALGVEAIPAVFVIGRDGRVVWNSDRRGTLNDAIDSALSKS